MKLTLFDSTILAAGARCSDIGTLHADIGTEVLAILVIALLA